MSPIPPSTPNQPGTQVLPGPVLVAGLMVLVVLIFGAAGLGWAGVVIVAGLLSAAYAVLIRWSQ